ncbi:hypothetical protein CHUBBYTHOR_84 [Shigella phage ChubbyThor]|nr:hypothetical protein CHUBBYTHOR_84 [Shigella phage ChubbyThor]
MAGKHLCPALRMNIPSTFPLKGDDQSYDDKHSCNHPACYQTKGERLQNKLNQIHNFLNLALVT